MKILLFTLLLLCTLLHGAKQNIEIVPYGLNEDLHDFIRLIPTYDMIRLYQSLSNQKYIIQPLDYFHSADFIAAVTALVEIPELKHVVDYMDNEGISLTEILEETVSRLGCEFWKNNNNATDIELKMNYFIEEASKLQDTFQIEYVLQQKYIYSQTFKKFLKLLQAVDINSLQSSAAKNPKIIKVVIKLTMFKVNIQELGNFLKLLFVGHYFD